jgi:hypothetical protein
MFSMTFYLLTIGFISILGQVVILRELNVAFYGVPLGPWSDGGPSFPHRLPSSYCLLFLAFHYQWTWHLFAGFDIYLGECPGLISLLANNWWAFSFPFFLLEY